MPVSNYVSTPARRQSFLQHEAMLQEIKESFLAEKEDLTTCKAKKLTGLIAKAQKAAQNSPTIGMARELRDMASAFRGEIARRAALGHLYI